MNQVIASTFEAVGRLRDKYYVQFSGLALFVAAVVLVVWTGPNLYHFAIAWLTIKIAILFGYIGMADARLGLPYKESLKALGRAATLGVLCSLPALVVIRILGSDEFWALAVAGAGGLAIFGVLWRTRLLVDGRDAVSRFRSSWRSTDAGSP